MPIFIKTRVHQWLRKLSIFKHPGIRNSCDPDMIQIAYDDQIYLHNGFYIAGVIRKHCQPYSEQYNELIKIRKIAELKSPQNWAILEPILADLGYEQLQNLEDEYNEGQITITENQLGEIIDFLFEKYVDNINSKKPSKQKSKKQFLDVVSFKKQRELSEAENSLEFMCLLFAQNFGLQLGQVLGLFVDNGKYLKSLIIQGSKKDQYQGIIKVLEILINEWKYIQSQLCANSDSQIDFILQGISYGLESYSNTVVQKTLQLLDKVKNVRWFQTKGNLRLLQSQSLESFNFLMERQKSSLSSIFNQNLDTKIPDRYKLLKILLNIVKRLPQSIYCKQILIHLPLSFIYKVCLKILDPESLNDYPSKVMNLAKELLTKTISWMPNKIPHNQIDLIQQIYSYYSNRLYSNQLQLIAMLFEIVESMLKTGAKQVIRFFKMIMKYLQNTYGQIRHWILENLISLYSKMSKQFPLGCFLLMYSTNAVAQYTQYKIFELICNSDNNHINQQQSKHLLQIISKYYQQQLHCKCFINLLRIFLHKNPKISKLWCLEAYQAIMKKLQNMDISILTEQNINILNPPLPNKNKVLQSIGLKRKQMLKYQNYDLNAMLLKQIARVRDKEMLIQYREYLLVSANRLSQAIQQKKNKLIKLYKNIAKQAKNVSSTIFETTPKMSQLMKAIVFNNSKLKNDLQNSNISLVQSRMQPAQSKYMASEINYFTLNQQTKLLQKSDLLDHNLLQNKQNDTSSLQIPEQNSLDNQFLIGAQTNALLQAKINIQQQSQLQPFSQYQVQIIPHFIVDDCLEHRQLLYIEMIKSRYRNILQYCKQLHENICDSHNNVDAIVDEFLSNLGLKKVVDQSQAEQMYIKTKIVNENTENFIEQFLIQLAMRIFQFLSNKRISITSLNSFFLMIQDYLNDKKVLHKVQLRNDKHLITKEIVFSNNVSSSLTKTMDQSYLVCYNALSDIMINSLGFSLVEPVSQILHRFTEPDQKKDHKESQQLEKLEQILAKSIQINVPANENFKQKKAQKSKPIISKNTFSKKKQPAVFIDITKNKSEKSLDNGLLKNKLQQRRKMLSAQIKANKKANKTQQQIKQEQQIDSGR